LFMNSNMNIENTLAALATSPTEKHRFHLFGKTLSAQIAIPYHNQKVTEYYRQACGANYPSISALADKEIEFAHFGLILAFEEQTVIPVCDEERHLEENLRQAVQQFGPVFIRNGIVDNLGEDFLQKNMFPGLSFHVDRGSHMENQISLFTRDPRDPDQAKPRLTSTLFMSRRATCYQAALEGKDVEDFQRCSNVFLFDDNSVEGKLGEVVLEQSWRAAEGVGEIGIIDNKAVFHASYHRGERGYAIGTRYLF
jgi:hypothetical protein